MPIMRGTVPEPEQAITVIGLAPRQDAVGFRIDGIRKRVYSELPFGRLDVQCFRYPSATGIANLPPGTCTERVIGQNDSTDDSRAKYLEIVFIVIGKGYPGDKLERFPLACLDCLDRVCGRRHDLQ